MHTDIGREHHGGRHGHHGGHHHDAFGPPWGRFRGGGWFGPQGRGRVRRGDVPLALLAVVAEQPRHGYDLIRELQERSGGMWHPSPGSIYPTLQMLEEQGLLSSEEVDGKRVYSITDEGRAHLEERRAKSGEVSQLGGSVMQVARAGDPEQVERVSAIVTEARKKVYAILSED